MLSLSDEFFQNLGNTDEVIIIGHSFGEVDLPCFRRIVEIAGRDVPWTIVYHDDLKKKEMENKARNLGISTIIMISSNEYWDR